MKLRRRDLWVAASFYARVMGRAPLRVAAKREKKTRAFWGRGSWSAPFWREGVWARGWAPEVLPAARLAQLGAGGRELGQHPCEPLGHTGHGGSPDGGAFTGTGHETTPFEKR
jgi:hypothetical protein